MIVAAMIASRNPGDESILRSPVGERKAKHVAKGTRAGVRA